MISEANQGKITDFRSKSEERVVDLRSKSGLKISIQISAGGGGGAPGLGAYAIPLRCSCDGTPPIDFRCKSLISEANRRNTLFKKKSEKHY